MLDDGVAFVNRHLDRGERVLVHCEHGIGRSATLALCVLVSRGMEPLDALWNWRRAAARSSRRARPNTRPGPRGCGTGRRGREAALGACPTSTPSRPSPTGICKPRPLMLVYGDQAGARARATVLDGIATRVAAARGACRPASSATGSWSPPSSRLGELAQGIADAEFDGARLRCAARRPRMPPWRC